jgi:hypothetical protein
MGCDAPPGAPRLLLPDPCRTSGVLLQQDKHKEQVQLVKSRTKKHAKKAAKRERAAEDIKRMLSGSSGGGDAAMADAAAGAPAQSSKRVGKKKLKIKKAKSKRAAASSQAPAATAMAE